MAFAVQAAQRRWQAWIIGITLALALAPASRAGHSNPNHNGDFDGDGYMNPTVYNESTGEWPLHLPISWELGAAVVR